MNMIMRLVSSTVETCWCNQSWDQATGGYKTDWSPDWVSSLCGVNPQSDWTHFTNQTLLTSLLLFFEHIEKTWNKQEQKQQSTLYAKGFDRGAVITVLDLVTEHTNECQVTNYAQRKKLQLSQYLVQTDGLELENGCPQAELTAMWVPVWAGFFLVFLQASNRRNSYSGLRQSGCNSGLAIGLGWCCVGFNCGHTLRLRSIDSLVKDHLVPDERPTFALKLQPIFWLSLAIWSVAMENQWSGNMKSFPDWFHWSAPLVSASNWSDCTAKSASGLGPLKPLALKPFSSSFLCKWTPKEGPAFLYKTTVAWALGWSHKEGFFYTRQFKKKNSKNSEGYFAFVEHLIIRKQILCQTGIRILHWYPVHNCHNSQSKRDSPSLSIVLELFQCCLLALWPNKGWFVSREWCYLHVRCQPLLGVGKECVTASKCQTCQFQQIQALLMLSVTLNEWKTRIRVVSFC